jgi:flavin reductase (DIM6/NTAB) family NADH-FMN oxidoreductase RutF
MLKEYNTLTSEEIYKLMSQTVIPRPIAWIVTENEGLLNVAPFSYFIPLSSKPPIVIVSIGHKQDNSPKDTLANIRKTKKATICFVNEENLEAMKLSANPLAKDESEIKTYNIKTKTVLEDYPPIVSSSKTALFCDYSQELDLGGKTVPILLEVKSQYFENGVLNENGDVILDNIARVGKEFARLEKI